MFLVSLLLIILGTTVIYTSNANLAIQQALFATIGTLGYFGLKFFDYRLLKLFSRHIYIAICLLLLIVFFLGIETRGSIRWIPLGFFNLQPSELAKLGLILVLSHFWSTRLPTWKNIFLSLGILGIPALMVFRQPDLGTTLTLVSIWISIIFAANLSFFKAAILIGVSTLLTPLVWSLLKTYQKVRLLSFLYPARDPLGVGYNVIQSTIAVGSGEIFGRGLGRGTQSRLQFLPEFRTDFIFAFIAEELGFLGSFIVLSLYSILFILLFRSLFRSFDKFGELIIVGVAGMFFFQIVVNIGMNIGIMPITGITLPFLSYGGSSIITSLLSLGIVDSIIGLSQRKSSDFETD